MISNYSIATASILIYSNLTWNFGGGQTGGVNDSLSTTQPTLDEFFFNNILFNSVGDPSNIGHGFFPSFLFFA